MKELRILFFGMLGAFSLPPLRALLAAGFPLVGVVIPGQDDAVAVRPLDPVTATSAGSRQAVSSGSAPTISHLLLTPTQSNIVHLAWQQQIPVYEISHLTAPETRRTLAELHPDVAVVACFNKRLPANLLTLPQHGFLNVHPSRLPHFRGPAPLFWTFQAGIQETGVTVHFMDEGLDTGDIAAQAPLTLPTGVSGREADLLTGTLGGQLLVSSLRQLANGSLTRSPQPSGGSAQPWPQAKDFRVPTTWSARRAFNFMRGTAEFGRPYMIEMAAGEIGGEAAPSTSSGTASTGSGTASTGSVLTGSGAMSFTPGSVLSQPCVSEGDTVLVQFADGVVTIHR